MAIKELNPKEKYDPRNNSSRATFVKAMDTLGDVKQYAEALSKNPNDPSARKDLGVLIHDNPLHYVETSADIVLNDASEAQSGLVRRIAGSFNTQEGKIQPGYVQNNLDDFLRNLKTEELAQVIQSLPLCKTGIKDLDEIVVSVRELQQVRNMDESEISEFVAKKVSKMPDYIQAAYFGYASASKEYIKRMFGSLVRSMGSKLERALIGPDGKLDRNKIVRVIKESIKVVEDTIEDEEDRGDKSDIYNAAILPFYMSLAQTTYPQDKKAKKKEDDEDKVERKAHRKEIGIAA